MIVPFVRPILILFCMMSVLLYCLLQVSDQPKQRQLINDFFASSTGCERQPCFLGIIPEETEQQDVYTALNTASIVDNFRMAQVEFGLRQMFIEWNGEQPNFLLDDGYITLVGERAETIEIATTLNLGDLVTVFGEPSHTVISTFAVYLYYIETGFVIESIINCDAIWYSSATVLWQQRVSLDNVVFDDILLHQVCD